MNTLTCLIKATSGRSFEPYVGSGMVDEKDRYQWDPAPDFPFIIKLQNGL